MQIEMISVSRVMGYAQNARVHSADQIKQIAGSIGEFGFTNPVLINAEDVLIAGHGRLEAAKSLGIEEVPAIRLGHLTLEQQRALVIADNRIAENSSWDEDLLASEIAALDAGSFDIAALGFAEGDITRLLDGLSDEAEQDGLNGDPDDVPDVALVEISLPGDVWILGEHRLCCGSATEAESYDLVMGEGGAADCVWTDPPYNVDYKGSAGKIKNDNMPSEQFTAFLGAAYKNIFAAMREGAAIYVAHADTEGLAFRSEFAKAGLKLSGCLVWEKPALVLGRSDYQWRHEPILYGWKPGAAHLWLGGRAQTTIMQDDNADLQAMPDGSLQITLGDQVVLVSGEKLEVEVVEGSVLRVDKPRHSKLHPTMKPIDLIVRMLRNSSQRGSIVLDPFGGSGSTLIACEVLSRKARLIELDPKFCDVIVRRWQEMTGKVATLEAGAATFAQIEADRTTPEVDAA